MDIQLYQIDAENYLVDFRNLGYRSVTRASPAAAEDGFTTNAGPGGLYQIPHMTHVERARAGSTSTNADDREWTRPQLPRSIQGVSSPFLFLEVGEDLVMFKSSHL